jgi:hypothetical protein
MEYTVPDPNEGSVTTGTASAVALLQEQLRVPLLKRVSWHRRSPVSIGNVPRFEGLHWQLDRAANTDPPLNTYLYRYKEEQS